VGRQQSPKQGTWINPTTAGDAKLEYGQGRPMSKDAANLAGAQFSVGEASVDAATGTVTVASRLFYHGTVAGGGSANDLSRLTDAREKGRIGILGSALSYAGLAGRVTSESIGRDLNPLGRGDGRAYVAGALNLGRIAPRLPGNLAATGTGTSVNNCGQRGPGIDGPAGGGDGGGGTEVSCGCNRCCNFVVGWRSCPVAREDIDPCAGVCDLCDNAGAADCMDATCACLKCEWDKCRADPCCIAPPFEDALCKNGCCCPGCSCYGGGGRGGGGGGTMDVNNLEGNTTLASKVTLKNCGKYTLDTRNLETLVNEAVSMACASLSSCTDCLPKEVRECVEGRCSGKGTVVIYCQTCNNKTAATLSSDCTPSGQTNIFLCTGRLIDLNAVRKITIPQLAHVLAHELLHGCDCKRGQHPQNSSCKLDKSGRDWTNQNEGNEAFAEACANACMGYTSWVDPYIFLNQPSGSWCSTCQCCY
jgi:hypothetical protein